MNFTIGADPELFLKDKGTGAFISAIGKFGGTKEQPRPIPDLPHGFFVQEDNVALEFNIPPANHFQAFSARIEAALEKLEIAANNLNLDLAIVPSARFAPEQLRDPRAKVFGCDPDFNVWSLKENPRPTTKDKSLRSAGGHVHVGGNFTDLVGLGRALDLFIGCPSIVFDKDRERRLLYGKAGAVRFKPYGIEYRTVSNFWIKSRRLSEMIFEQAKAAVQFTVHNGAISDDDSRKIIHCINDANEDLLRELTPKYGLQY